MKQKLLKLMLLLAVGMMGVSARADVKTKTEGFESATTGTNYQGTVTVNESQSDCGIGWEIYYGTVSTNAVIAGSNSAQMRLYTNGTKGYLQTTTAIDGLTKFSFKAAVSNTNVKADIYYSTDGENWVSIKSGETYTTSATKYEYNIPDGGKYVKIAVGSTSTAPSSKNYTFRVDDVVFTYEEAAVPDDALVSIALSGTYPTSFILGDSFSSTGLIVTATYGNGDEADVTASATISGYDMNTRGTQTVTVSYTEDDITKSATYEIGVYEDGVFDFTDGADYGSSCPSGNSSSIGTTEYTWTAGNVTIVTAGRHIWDNKTCLKLYKETASDAAGNITVSVPVSYFITEIEFTMGDKNTLVGITDEKWIGYANSVTIATGTDRSDIKTITVTYTNTNTYTRSTASGNYGTLCLPYDATVEGATLYTIAGKELTGSEVTALVLAEAASVEAGKPYIFKATADDVVATFTGTVYTAAGAVNGLYGTYAAIAANTWDTYIAAGEDLYLMTTSKVQAADKETSSLAANRAYIAMSEVSVYTGSEVKGIRLGFDGTETPTGINGLTPALSKGEGVIYNLNGQRVNSLQRGINIVGGKKILVK